MDATAQSESKTATLAEANAATAAVFVRLLGGIVEHSPSVAEAVVVQRPFKSVDAIWLSMMNHIEGLSSEHLDDLFRLHPELAGAEAISGQMTSHSTSEQGRLGLSVLAKANLDRLTGLNARYRAKFGFPCIIALRLQASLTTLFTEFERRLERDIAAERNANLYAIGQIVRGRLYQMFVPSGWLSTHVLDTARGSPATGMRIDLYETSDDRVRLISSVAANADGRTDKRLLTGATMTPGTYRLDFHVGAYFRSHATKSAQGDFLDVVPVLFSMTDADAHYHVPLLCTPWSYSTYRGS